MVISHNGLKALLITLKLLLVIFAIEVYTLYKSLFIILSSFHVQNVKRVKIQNEVCDLATGRLGRYLACTVSMCRLQHYIQRMNGRNIFSNEF